MLNILESISQRLQQKHLRQSLLEVAPTTLNKRATLSLRPEPNMKIDKIGRPIDNTLGSSTSLLACHGRLALSLRTERVPLISPTTELNELITTLQRSIALLKATDRSLSLPLRFKAYTNLLPPTKPSIVKTILKEFWMLHAWRSGCMYERDSRPSESTGHDIVAVGKGKLCMPPSPDTATTGLVFTTTELLRWQIETRSKVTAPTTTSQKGQSAPKLKRTPNNAPVAPNNAPDATRRDIIRNEPRGAFNTIKDALPPDLRQVAPQYSTYAYHELPVACFEVDCPGSERTEISPLYRSMNILAQHMRRQHPEVLHRWRNLAAYKKRGFALLTQEQQRFFLEFHGVVTDQA